MLRDGEQFADVVRAAAVGQRAAWEALYRSYAPPILGFLRAQRVASPEDLLGETWLQVVRDINRFVGDADGFRRWVLQIAHNRARSSWGQRDQQVLTDRPDTRCEPAQGVDECQDVFGDLTPVIALLPPSQRSVLYLRFVLDLPVKDVADILASSSGAVKMTQARALARVEAILDHLAEPVAEGVR